MIELLGPGDEVLRLLAAAGERRVPHGLILEGARGGGKSTAARVLATALLCGEDGACGRRVASGAHADLHLVDLPPDRQDIPVDRVRELQAELERRPVEGRARVAVVDPADRMNEQGQNALLKTLEEPGEHTFLILVTSRPEGLLDTVRSRCRRVRILPLDDATLRGALEPPRDASAEDVERAVRASGGSLGLARELLGEPARAVARGVAEFLAAPRPAAVSATRGLLDGVTGRTETEHRVGLIRRILSSELRARMIPIAPAGGGVAGDSASGYGPADAEPWLSAVEAVFEAQQDLASGIPVNQVLDAIFLRLVDLLGGGSPTP